MSDISSTEILKQLIQHFFILVTVDFYVGVLLPQDWRTRRRVNPSCMENELSVINVCMQYQSRQTAQFPGPGRNRDIFSVKNIVCPSSESCSCASAQMTAYSGNRILQLPSDFRKDLLIHNVVHSESACEAAFVISN